MKPSNDGNGNEKDQSSPRNGKDKESRMMTEEEEIKGVDFDKLP